LEALYDLDGPQFADATGYIGGTDDSILHVRCFVVAMGRDFCLRALGDPEGMPKEHGSWCEPLLFAARYAWARKTGEEMHFVTMVSFKTCSNASLWRGSPA
jgi:hypothetical protein